MKNLILIIIWITSIQAYSQVTSYLDIAYDTIEGSDQNLVSLDVYIPETDHIAPILIYVHGGAWTIGDKSIFHEKMRHFTDQGYIFVSINYRLSPFPYELDNPDRITFPTHPQDVGKAISFVLDNATQYGGDTTKITLMGHSAGAHLVSLIITDDRYLKSHGYDRSHIKCACSFDTAGFDINDRLMLGSLATYELYTNAFTEDPDTWFDASPIYHISGETKIPEILVVMQNTLLRERAAINFEQAVLSEYPDHKIDVLFTDYAHDDLNQLIGSSLDSMSITYTSEVTDWIYNCINSTTASQDIAKQSLDLFPNPVADVLNLPSDLNYEVISLSGSLLIKGKGTDIKINHLKSGTYLLRCAVDGYETNTKFIKL